MNDIDIIKAIRKNPDIGLSFLMDKYIGLVCSVINGVFSSYTCFSAEDIEECASDVFYEFYRNVGNFRHEAGSIKSFLCVIAKHKAIDIVRKRSAENTLISIDDEDNFMQIAEELAVEDELLTSEMRKLLFTEIEALGKPDSEIITRKFFFRESTKSIAERLGLSISNVDTRTYRALKKLRDKIGGI